MYVYICIFYHRLREFVTICANHCGATEFAFYFFFKYRTFQERHADLVRRSACTIIILFKSVEEITFLWTDMYTHTGQEGLPVGDRVGDHLSFVFVLKSTERIISRNLRQNRKSAGHLRNQSEDIFLDKLNIFFGDTDVTMKGGFD